MRSTRIKLFEVAVLKPICLKFLIPTLKTCCSSILSAKLEPTNWLSAMLYTLQRYIKYSTRSRVKRFVHRSDTFSFVDETFFDFQLDPQDSQTDMPYPVYSNTAKKGTCSRFVHRQMDFDVEVVTNSNVETMIHENRG